MKHTVTEHILASGAKGLVIHVPGSAVVTMRVVFRSGYQYSPKGKYEIPHVLEHLMATVTDRHREPNSYMIDASRNGAYVNATTAADTNQYVYECAAFELPRMLKLVAEQVSEPWFDSVPFAAEISNVREELSRNTTQHMSVCSVALVEHAFPDQWLGYDSRIAQLEDISVEDLHRHYHSLYGSRNARFYLAGDFSDGGAEAVTSFEQMFSRLPLGKRQRLSQSVGRGAKEPILNVREIDQIYYRAGYFWGEISEQQRYAMMLLRAVLTGGMSSRVLGEARRRGLAYSVGATWHAEQGNSSLGFGGYVTKRHAMELFEVMQRSLADVASGAVKVQELDEVKDRSIGGIVRSTQTASDLLGSYIDRYEDEDVIEGFEASLEQIRAVTPAAVREVAEIALASTEFGLSLVGPVSRDEARSYQQAITGRR